MEKPTRVLVPSPAQRRAGRAALTQAATRRRRFEKELLAALGPALKGSGWKKSGGVLFRQSGVMFQEVGVSVSLLDGTVGVTQKIKPMALDPILWDILGLTENASAPLSFRATGAFTCGGLPIGEASLDETGDGLAATLAALVGIVGDTGRLAEQTLAGADFSALVAQHPNQAQRGAYAVTLVTSLINDGDRDAAVRLAGAYLSGTARACANLRCDGVSFHRLALDWLAAQTSADAGNRP